LGIIDIQDVYTPFTENTEDFKTRIGTVNSAVSTLEQRQLNSSYGCTYYPWVQIRDTIKGNLLWAPPSVIALGTFASSQAKSELWFAPAGFNRGGLTDGSAGLPVLGLTQRLTSKDRDNLYETNINPIASFPSEGIVVFGQKTLQTTPSALDRINVRRLLVYIKKEVSRIAATILFDQNVKVTWERFLGQVNPFLSSVQSRLGLTEFRVILDSTTTTPDLIDRNILYAKIFLKPARAIEFIAIDFVITRTGASFED
jgi:phage tail sheath protein FI